MATNPQPGSLIFGRTAGNENLPVKVNDDGTLDITVSVGGASSTALNDGVDNGIKATVIESTANPGTFGLVALASDGADISGGGGGGGAVTVADGADVTQGAIADAKVTGDNTGTASAKLRGLNYLWALAVDTVNSWVKVSIQNSSIAVTGTFWQATQPVSGTVTAAQATASSLNAQVVGDVAADAADAGNPVKVGGKAVSSEPAAVTANDRANFITDLVGKHIVLPYANPENFVSGAITSAMTGTTSTSLVAAPGSGLRNYITTIIVSNAHASVGTDVIIQDGNGGTTLMTIPAAAVYGGAVIHLPVPLRQPTTNTALYCANVTTGASTKVSAVGYKGA